MTEGWKFVENEEFRVPAGELIGIMCDIVSKGGKFLINIGPAPDGSIVEADRETLLEIGKWLDVNGEAIYGTEPVHCEPDYASETSQDRAKDLLLPKSGINDFPNVWKQMQAFNQDQGPIRFTKKGPYIYAMHMGWPGEKLEFNKLSVTPGSEIRMLGVEESLYWKEENNKLIIKLPSEKPCEHAYVLKMKLSK